MFQQLADALGLEMNNIEDHILGDEKVSHKNVQGVQIAECIFQYLCILKNFFNCFTETR